MPATAFPADRLTYDQKVLGGDVWNPNQALAMSAALADLQRQVRERR